MINNIGLPGLVFLFALPSLPGLLSSGLALHVALPHLLFGNLALVLDGVS